MYIRTNRPQPIYDRGIWVIVLPITVVSLIGLYSFAFFAYKKYKHGYWFDKNEPSQGALSQTFPPTQPNNNTEINQAESS